MNTLSTLPLILFSFLCSAQSKKSNTKVIHVTLTARYKPANVTILKDGLQIATMELNTDIVKYKKPKPGLYCFVTHDEQGHLESRDSVFVNKGASLEVEMKAPCVYNQPADYIPLCPEKHTDNIIPIFYGLLVQVNDDYVVEKEEYYSGGCNVTDCDPKFYCKIHDTRF